MGFTAEQFKVWVAETFPDNLARAIAENNFRDGLNKMVDYVFETNSEAFIQESINQASVLRDQTFALTNEAKAERAAIVVLKFLIEQQKSFAEAANVQAQEAAERAELGLIPKGAWNPVTNTPTLTATPDPAFVNGSYYDIVFDSGNPTMPFAGQNFSIGRTLTSGDRLKKIGTQWSWVKHSDLAYIETQKLKESIDRNIAPDVYGLPFVDPDDIEYGGFLKTGEWLAINYALKSIAGNALKDSSIPLSALSMEVKGYMFEKLDPASGYVFAHVTIDDYLLWGVTTSFEFVSFQYVGNSVPGTAIKDTSITGSKLQDGTISEAKLSPALKTSINSSRPTNALQALAQMAVRRVAMVDFGDSNEKMDGQGWDYGWGYALKNRFQQYASPVYSCKDGGIANEGYETGKSGISGGSGTIPTQFGQALYPSNKEAYYNELGDMSSTNGITILAGSSLGVNNMLRCHVKFGKFPGAGIIRPGWRRESSPYTQLINYPDVNLNSAEYETVYQSFDLPASARGFDIAFKYRMPSGASAVSPNLLFTGCIENPACLAGWQRNVLYAAGGQSLYDFAAYAKNQTLLQLSNYFGDIRRLQIIAGQKPIIVVYINSALNDRNETVSPSLGYRASTTPDSSTAYIDNLDYLVSRLEDAYQLKGWDVGELYFLVMPSHPVASPDDSKLVSYRKAAHAFAGRQRCSFVDLTTITSYEELLANSWYKDGPDVNHLTLAAYNELATRVTNLIPTL